MSEKKLNLLLRSAILIDFQNQGYRFTVPKPQRSGEEKKEEGGERQLQSVIRYKQTQKYEY